MKQIDFSGPFAPMCEEFVAQKQAMGRNYLEQAGILRRFDNFCKDYKIKDFTITEEIAVAWCKKRPNEKEITRHARIAEMQRFSTFLCQQGYESYLLPALPKCSEKHRPYIFSENELHKLFRHLDALEPIGLAQYRHLVYPCLFRILYGCGLRISEALGLVKSDVDLENGVLHIRHGKNDNERLIPMSQSVAEHCRKYAAIMHAFTADDIPFFYTRNYSPYTRSSVGKAFRGFLWDIGIPYRGKDFGPRVHDLRHTFVCHNIRHWAEGNTPIYSKLPILSKYLGHSSISATQWYLRLSADVYPHIRSICELEFGGMYAESLAEYGEVTWDE